MNFWGFMKALLVTFIVFIVLAYGVAWFYFSEHYPLVGTGMAVFAFFALVFYLAYSRFK